MWSLEGLRTLYEMQLNMHLSLFRILTLIRYNKVKELKYWIEKCDMQILQSERISMKANLMNHAA